MKIAFTHNLMVTGDEAEAEFDSPETVGSIAEALRALGHSVDIVEVSGSAAQLVARLEALRPDLVFNTAEGRWGRYREAFFPALFDQLGLRYTGSDAFACAVTLDKRLTKMLVGAEGVPTPAFHLIERDDQAIPDDLRYPVIVKPNFEGSSKGISAESVVSDGDALRARVRRALRSYPEGVLIEEFIEGKDVVVPFIEGVSPETRGILPASEYVFEAGVANPLGIYDYALKHEFSAGVAVRTPAAIPESLGAELVRHAEAACRILGLRDLGRADFRITPDGRCYLLEVNALPSLEPGAAIYEAAALVGLDSVERVLEAVVESARTRHRIPVEGQARATTPPRLRVGLAYNLKRVKPATTGEADEEAEFDAPETVGAIRRAIDAFGHEVVPLEATPEFLERIRTAQVDVVFNIAEGIRGRGREAFVPAVLDLLDIPYTGSDPTTMALALDKGLAKRLVRQAGIATPDFILMQTGDEPLPEGFGFPLIVKPVHEGSSKGVLGSSVAHDEAELRRKARTIVERYDQPALVEAFLEGREFTVAVLGEDDPRVLPPMEILFSEPGEAYPVYSFARKQQSDGDLGVEVPARLETPLAIEIERVARAVFQVLGCRDVARVDLRLDHLGAVNFIECNPLPGLTPGWSDLCLIAEATGMSYGSLIGEILAPSLRRRAIALRRRTRDGEESR